MVSRGIGCFFLAAAAWAAHDNNSRALQSIRLKVAGQLSKSANYACVETLERTYLRGNSPTSAICSTAEDTFEAQEIMRDRLRLNLAVSQGSEIFSWRGENKFISANIDKIVQSGPISSGSFVGFIRNIFMDQGVKFVYRGGATEQGAATLRFDYKVGKAVSRFRIEGQGGKAAIVAFHGSFSANAATFELARLKIVADQIPSGLNICSTESEVRYQMANISGARTLIPQSFQLQIDSADHIHTVSKGDYSQCHEFRAESRLRFDTPNVTIPEFSQRAVERWLPAGLNIHAALMTNIDGKTAFTGDALEARVTEAVNAPNGKTLVPANAILHGVITQLETFYSPGKYYALRIEFNRVSFGDRTLLLRAIHRPTGKEEKVIRSIYSSSVGQIDRSEIEQGTIFIRSDRLHLDQKFQGEWSTLLPPIAAQARMESPQ